MNIFELLLKRPLFAPEDGGGSGEDTSSGEGDDTVPAGDDTVSAGDDTAPADDDDSLITKGKDDDEPPKEEPVTEETLKEILPEKLELSEEQSSSVMKLINESETKADLAKGLMSMYQEATTSAAEATDAQWNDTQTQWQKEVQDSPDFGGEKLEQSLAKANEVAKEYGGDDFMQLLNLTGAGNNLAMVAFLNKVHAALPQEGKPASGNPAGGAEKSLADRLFPSTT